MVKTISRSRLVSKDSLEIIKFAYAIDPEYVAQQFYVNYGIRILSEADLIKFANGSTPYGTKHGFSVDAAAASIKFRENLLPLANITYTE